MNGRGESISAIVPLAKDPTMRHVRIGKKTMATLRAADVEALGIEIGTVWSADLARRVQDCVAMNKARRAALTMLGRRPFSRAELVERLINKGHDSLIARRLADELAADRWIDDEQYARSVAGEKIRRGPASRQLMQSKLESRQIEPNLAARVADESLAAIDTTESALALVRRRLGTMSKVPPAKARQRIAALLARRGFDEDFVAEILDRLKLKPADEES